MVEESDDAQSLSNFLSCGPSQNANRSYDGESSQTAQNSRSQKRNKEAELLHWLQQLPAAPISNIFKTDQYYKSKFVFWNFKKFRNNQILKIFNKQFLTMSMHQLGEYSFTVNPIYNASNGNIEEYYYNIEISLIWMDKILFHNFENYNEIRNFLINLIIVLDKVKPKLNTVV